MEIRSGGVEKYDSEIDENSLAIQQRYFALIISLKLRKGEKKKRGGRGRGGEGGRERGKEGKGGRGTFRAFSDAISNMNSVCL